MEIIGKNDDITTNDAAETLTCNEKTAVKVNIMEERAVDDNAMDADI